MQDISSQFGFRSDSQVNSQVNSQAKSRDKTPQPRPLSVCQKYSRHHDLTPLIPLWPRQLADQSVEGTRLILKLLEKALRSERTRGRAGHWTYNLTRHQALKAAYDGEKSHLKKIIMEEKRKRMRGMIH